MEERAPCVFEAERVGRGVPAAGYGRVVLFLLDHDADAAVGRMLRRKGHDCLTASQVGLAAATDDALTVWASEHRAVVLTTDREFSRKRMQNAIGHQCAAAVWTGKPMSS